MNTPHPLDPLESNEPILPPQEEQEEKVNTVVQPKNVCVSCEG